MSKRPHRQSAAREQTRHAAEGYRDQNAFKVFMLDIGLLGAMSGLSPAALVDGSSIFTEFKGALTEQYVCQQLVSDCGLVPFYWSAENSSGEIDFLRAGRVRRVPPSK